MKKLMLITAPVTSRSGYGDHARSIFYSIMDRDDLEIKCVDVRWGSTPRNHLDPKIPKHKKLLDTFICSVNSSFAGTNTSYDDLILKLLPSTINLNQNSLYSRLLEDCHFVASLSDRKALNVYNKITGVEYQ